MWRIGIFLVILLTLSACVPATPTLDVGDGGFLSGEPCGPPCFWGIVPGQTMEAEVMEILQERGVFKVCRAHDREAEGGIRGIICPQFAVGFRRGGNVVDDVVLWPSTPITAEEIIAKYGEPEFVKVGGLGIHVIRFIDLRFFKVTVTTPIRYIGSKKAIRPSPFPFVPEKR
jgi:hypothetical protein